MRQGSNLNAHVQSSAVQLDQSQRIAINADIDLFV
ncbi:MAG: hypothetical protein ACI906_003021, partial [Candidatus Latescibacterota bacterium]